MRNRAALIFILCALVLTAFAAPARATQAAQAQSTITVSATAGFGDTGYYVLGEWVPIRVTLTNPQGGQSTRVTVRVTTSNSSGGTVYQREVDLPSPSRKEITLYSYDSNFARVFQVRVYEGDKEIGLDNAVIDPLEPPLNLVVGVASSDSSLLNILKNEKVGNVVEPLPSTYGYYGGNPTPGANGTATIAHISLADIPALSQALDSLGALVFDDVDTGTLTEEQRAAIEAWVARGGTLITTYRAGGADTLAGFANLSPVTVSGSRNASTLAGLAELVSVPITSSGTLAIGNAQVRQDLLDSTRVLATSDGTPLLASRDLGRGQVLYMGMSPSLPPMRGWDGLIPLFKRLLAEHDLKYSYGSSMRGTSVSSYMSFPGMTSVFETYGSMFVLPGLELPSAWLVGGFLLLYIMIVGPINFIILRRMKRVELAWFTIPVLVALFSGVAYVLALGSKGADIVSIRANAIYTAEGTEQATVLQHFGLFSPARRTYQLDLNTDSLLNEINAYGYYYGGSSSNSATIIGGNGTTSIRDINIDTWSIRGFLAEHTAKLSSPLTSDLELSNNSIVGKVTNNTNGPLQDVALLRGRAYQYIGFMAPGESVDVNLPVTSGIFDNSSPARLLPPPAGVSAPSSAYYGGSNNRNPAQRLYDRKVELLSVALYPLVSGEAPTDLDVIMLAWGPSPSTSFGVQGYNTTSEEINVWSSTAHVKNSTQARLDSGAVPYAIYAPGNVSSGGSGVPPSVQQFIGFMLNSSSTPIPGGGYNVIRGSGSLGSSSAVTYSQIAGENAKIQIFPYAELQFRLPGGTKPDSLTLRYLARQSADSELVSLSAYNTLSQQWDTLNNIDLAEAASVIHIPAPKEYTSLSGEVTLRLQPTKPTTIDGTFEMALNE